jgi:hypothetical protein
MQWLHMHVSSSLALIITTAAVLALPRASAITPLGSWQVHSQCNHMNEDCNMLVNRASLRAPPFSWSSDLTTVLWLLQNGIATNYGGPADGMSPGSPSFGTLAGSCGYGLLDKGKWPYW